MSEGRQLRRSTRLRQAPVRYEPVEQVIDDYDTDEHDDCSTASSDDSRTTDEDSDDSYEASRLEDEERCEDSACESCEASEDSESSDGAEESSVK